MAALPEVEVLIVTALRAEGFPLLRRMRRPRRLGRSLAIGSLAGIHVALARVGVGRECARRGTEAALARCDAARVLSVGTCGALVDALRVGQVVGAVRILDAAGALPLLRPAWLQGAVVATVPRAVDDPSCRAAWAACGADVCEMEAAGVAEAAATRPFGALKVVSDLAGATRTAPSPLPRALRVAAFQLRAWRVVDGPLVAVLERWLPELCAQPSHRIVRSTPERLDSPVARRH